MALIRCPECGKDISDKAKTCIQCGYPISEYMAKSQDNTTSNTEYRVVLRRVGANPRAIRNVCQQIGADYDKVVVNLPFIIRENMTYDDANKIVELFNNTGCLATAEDSSEPFSYEKPAFSDSVNHNVANISYSNNTYNNQQKISYSKDKKPMITCPYCGSNSCKKVSELSRIVSVDLLGLSSKMMGKQWYCKSCKSYF